MKLVLQCYGTNLKGYKEHKGYKPYGTAEGNYVAIGEGIKNDENSMDDWGVIKVYSELGEHTGMQGIKASSDLELNYNTLISRGYPFEHPYSDIIEMYEARGSIMSYKSDRIITDMDIEHGQSGAPVNFTGYENTVIGIVKGGVKNLFKDRNSIVRLTPSLVGYLSEFRYK